MQFERRCFHGGVIESVLFLQFYELRLRFLAHAPVSFPEGKAGNVLRGAFGSMLRKHSCHPHCNAPQRCPLARECAYAAIFEPRASERFANPPRPFVFRADRLDGHTIQAGRSFEFAMNLFDRSPRTLQYVINAFSDLHALGNTRSPVQFLSAQTRALSFDFSPGPGVVSRIRVDFKTPTELKANNEIVDRPEFPILYSRAAERIAALFPGLPAIPVCQSVQLIGCSLQNSRVERRSSKTGQRHRIGGFIGHAEYQGDLRECLPILKAAEFTGVGRHTAWGNGRIEVVTLAYSD